MMVDIYVPALSQNRKWDVSCLVLIHFSVKLSDIMDGS